MRRAGTVLVTSAAVLDLVVTGIAAAFAVTEGAAGPAVLWSGFAVGAPVLFWMGRSRTDSAIFVRCPPGRFGQPKYSCENRRTCTRLCHLTGGELEQIHFLLGHVSIQTNERYLGCKQKLRCAVTDKLGLEP